MKELYKRKGNLCTEDEKNKSTGQEGVTVPTGHGVHMTAGLKDQNASAEECVCVCVYQGTCGPYDGHSCWVGLVGLQGLSFCSWYSLFFCQCNVVFGQWKEWEFKNSWNVNRDNGFLDSVFENKNVHKGLGESLGSWAATQVWSD